MFKVALALTALAVGGAAAQAAVLEVGVGKKFTTLSAAAAAAASGDTVIVYPGSYSGATWYDSNLIIKKADTAAAGSVIVTGKAVGDKGLFVVKGSNITVDGLRFVGARATAGNGAGIRQEGLNLVVRNSSFYNNEMGVLATPYPVTGGALTIQNSSFDNHKSYVSGHIGHSVYGNTLDKLTVTGSKFTRDFVGHYVKSRAKTTVVTGNTIDDSNGSASYLINVPEGGAATIANNTLIKGANASNCCVAISYGEEMYKGGSYVNPAGPVSIRDNIFTNKRATTVYFVSNRSAPSNPAVLYGNKLSALSGTVKALNGAGSVNVVIM